MVGLVGFVVITRRLQPYRMRQIDKERAIFRISFHNPAYTAVIIRRLAERDGVDVAKVGV